MKRNVIIGIIVGILILGIVLYLIFKDGGGIKLQPFAESYEGFATSNTCPQSMQAVAYDSNNDEDVEFCKGVIIQDIYLTYCKDNTNESQKKYFQNNPGSKGSEQFPGHCPGVTQTYLYQDGKHITPTRAKNNLFGKVNLKDLDYDISVNAYHNGVRLGLDDVHKSEQLSSSTDTCHHYQLDPSIQIGNTNHTCKFEVVITEDE
jgi:hypothetical protein